MTAISTKPVKECRGCKLNLIKRCAVFEHPVLKWQKRRCEGYNNPTWIEKYEKSLHPEGARARKMQRRQRAALARTIPHRDGTHPLGPIR